MNIPEVVRCPKCGGAIEAGAMKCIACNAPCYAEYGRLSFISPDDRNAITRECGSDRENAVKNFFKRWPRFYSLFSRAISPVLFTGMTAPRFVRRYGPFKRLLNVGSGPTRLQTDVLNIDLFPFDGVDILTRAEALPFSENTFDAVCSDEVLEHVNDAQQVVQEIVRVTKIGGLIYLGVPFVFPYHPSPNDYRRWTIAGLCASVPNCRVVASGVMMGPTSGTMSIFAVWLATICSFGISPLRKILKYFFMIILSPLKLLDLVYARLPGAEETAAAVYVVCRKVS